MQCRNEEVAIYGSRDEEVLHTLATYYNINLLIRLQHIEELRITLASHYNTIIH